jgi:hypothetical protein
VSVGFFYHKDGKEQKEKINFMFFTLPFVLSLVAADAAL